MQVEKSDVAAVLALLRSYGYAVETSRLGDRRRIALRHGTERWSADAASTADALNALLGQMLPSAMTKALFASAVTLAAQPSQPAAPPSRSTSSASGPHVVVRRRAG